MSLVDYKEILESLVSGADATTKASSMKTATWRCLNVDHKKEDPVKWEERVRARVYYSYCPKCSYRPRPGRKCQECDTSAKFAFPSERRGSFCSIHKKSGMADVMSKRCAMEKCDKQPSYNYEGGQALYCAFHRKIDMIDVTNPRCNFEGCNKQPSYNYEGEHKGLYCAKHKMTGMLDVASKRCIANGCNKHPSFKYQGEHRALYCFDHKIANMIGVKKRRCIAEGCPKIPSFNYRGESPLYCVNHKAKEMVNVINKKCVAGGCKKGRFFNHAGQSKGLYCSQHRLKGMEDVTSPKCSIDKCPFRASFAQIGQLLSHCYKHAQQGMINRPRKRCSNLGCDVIATMGSSLTHTNEFCELHAPSDYISLLITKCKTCSFLSIINKDGYCRDCDPNRSKEVLAKQNKVISWLRTDLRSSDFTSLDSVLPETKACVGSKRYRPDITYQREEGYYIIVEVDENQHQSESYKKCDRTRMINIHQDVMAPVYFIRYNPDSYKVGNEKVAMSEIKRKRCLIEWITAIKNYPKEGKVTEGLHVLYLFYNGYCKGEEKWVDVDPYVNDGK